jgi:cyclic nucleotide gated channel alpha 3
VPNFVLQLISPSSFAHRCHWSFVFDPAGRLCYYWSMVVSLAFLYNFWVIIFRFSFAELSFDSLAVWFSLDYLMDLIYLLDIVFHFRTGYLEVGGQTSELALLREGSGKVKYCLIGTSG